jgi:transcriptional regulator with XRE-family HTH domain
LPKSVFTDAYAIFLEALVEARKTRRFSQKKLGRELGKSQPWVSNCERGERRVDIVEFYALAQALKYNPAELFESITDRFPKNMSI